MQEEDYIQFCKGFLRSAGEAMNWGSLNQEVVIEIGCGSGKSTKALIEAYPDVRNIIAFDYKREALQQASNRHLGPQILFDVADIRSRRDIARWEGRMDKAVSFFCFNCLVDDDARRGCENLFLLLKPGGEAAILQSLRSGFYDFVKEIKDWPKWRPYFETANVGLPTSHTEGLTVDDYRKMYRDAGFEIVRAYEEKSVYGTPFESDANCKEALINNCLLTTFIPPERREEFVSDGFEVFLKYNPRDRQGRCLLEQVSLAAFLRKPQTAG